jgi:tRNA (guanine26-N2/guanine27-N2)-dimethyltransferase
MAMVSEGKAKFLVPRQPVTRKAEAFYNPEMEYQRDITMSALRSFFAGRKTGISVCDPLAGTGVRSIRILKEVPGVSMLVANDRNPRTFRVLKRNLSGMKNVKAEVVIQNEDANALMAENPRAFDYVDIDPFGSPVHFLQAAAGSLRNGSMLACTATDTGALCGAFPSTCMSRYGFKNTKTDFFKETGIRTLTTAIMQELVKHGLSFTPLYSHANHYFRVMGKVGKSRSVVSSRPRDLRMLSYCRKCHYRTFEVIGKCPKCAGRTENIGPLWTGKIKDTVFCRKMLADLERLGYNKTKEMETAIGELDEPFYYDLHKLFKIMKMHPVKTEKVMENIRRKGFRCSRTHLSDTGIKTNADYDSLLESLE